MFAKSRVINRSYYGKDIQNFMEIPNLIDIQTSSYESFLQKEKLDAGEPLEMKGLQEVFSSIFPIESQDGNMYLDFDRYELDEAALSEQECKQKNRTYAAPLQAWINLVLRDTGTVQEGHRL